MKAFKVYDKIKETETLSYTLLCQLYDEVKELEENTMNDILLHGQTGFLRESAVLTIKYLIEDKLFILWKEINKSE